MTQTADADLYRRVEALLEPGEIQLNGLVLHTDLTTDEESVLHERTVAVGEIIAEHATDEDTYIYSGNDDPEFGLNQHQGLTLTGDEFVWECQQLLRNSSYDVVFYYEAIAEHEAILTAVETETEFRTIGITG
jgi:hypothetical protein